MPWTDTTRGDYCRRDLRYASDCRDDEWGLIAPFLEPCSRVGRPREVEMRHVWKPDVVVTEIADRRSRKGKRTKELIRSIAAIASHNEVLDVSVERPRRFPLDSQTKCDTCYL